MAPEASRHWQAPVRDVKAQLIRPALNLHLDLARVSGIGMFNDIVQRFGQNQFRGAEAIFTEVLHQGAGHQVAQAFSDVQHRCLNDDAGAVGRVK